MNFCHVHWSKPMRQQRWGFEIETHRKVILYHYSLSVAYIKKLGQTIDLYTDSEGTDLLGHLPYDNIYIVLDNMDDRIQYYNWAAGKIEGIKHMKIGDVYIDGDVFIKTQNCLDRIESSKIYDGFFFGHENPGQEGHSQLKIYSYYEYYMHHYSYPQGVPKYGQSACNGGLILFHNQQYKDEFIYSYEYLLQQIMDSPPIIDDDVENKVCLDLIMEQRFLWEIGQKYKIEYLIDYWQRDEDNIRNLNTQANFVGVQHVIGDQKYSLLNKCISVLQKINPDIYQKSYEKLQSYI